jgi:hypothetical protein
MILQFKRIVKVLDRLLGTLPPEVLASELRYALKNSPLKSGVPVTKSSTFRLPLVAIESVEDPFYLGLFGDLLQQLQTRGLVRATRIVVRSLNGAIGTGALCEVARSPLVAALIERQWRRVWSGLVDERLFRAAKWQGPWRLTCLQRHAARLIASCADEDSLARLKVDDVLIGDLVIDSYLRFRPAVGVDLADPFLIRVLRQALSDLVCVRSAFCRERPDALIMSHSTYIEHGIPARIALQLGIPVWTFGNFMQIGRRLHLDDPFHTPVTRHYRNAFDALPDQEACLAEADKQLRRRLAGEIDTTTSYMRVSAYQASSEVAPAVAGAIIVFLHDFYDSPHIYEDLVYPDFWSWIIDTIDTLNASGQPFWIKPHPNQIALSDEAIKKLCAKYPNLPILSPNVTNVQLVEAGMLSGVTVYGTVAHELAYLGVPSICSARHPHHAFDFCRTARSVGEYRTLLKTPTVLPLTLEEMRRQALAFFYMHNLAGSADTLELRKRYVAYWKACHLESKKASDAVDALRQLHDAPGWQSVATDIYEKALSNAL